MLFVEMKLTTLFYLGNYLFYAHFVVIFGPCKN